MKRLIVILSVMALVLSTAVAAYAENATVNITAGSLAVGAAGISLSGATLSGGTSKTSTSAFDANNWTASDSTGSGSGWNLTVKSTDFTNADTKTISTADNFKIQLTEPHIVLTDGNAKPTTSVSALTAIPISSGSALKFASAASTEGMGSYTINPNFALNVPAQTYAGAYTATVTVAIVTAP